MKNKKTIPSAGPSITKREIKLVNDAVRNGWYEQRNVHLDKFTQAISGYTGVRYCLPTVNCTSAIHLALLSIGIGPGDEVIVPDITWVASAAPIHYVGATPVFADIDKRTWCLSPESFKKAITAKTKAVVIVDLYGNMPDMDALLKIARANNIAVIEDAAESMGSEYKNKKAGTFGKVGVLSFNATKLMMAGQGGMLLTNDKNIFEKAKKLAHHGMKKYTLNATFWSEEIGYNYQWTNLQAALALAQFERLDELLEKKRNAFKWYSKELKNIPGILLNPSGQSDIKNNFWITVAILDPKYGLTKERLMKKFRKHNIDLRPFFYPISSMPAYAQYTKSKNMRAINPASYEIAPYGICFPSAMSLTKKDIKYICDCLKKELKI